MSTGAITKLRVIPLGELDDAFPAAGGKATGLARLRRAGLRVPDGFVVIPDEQANPANIEGALVTSAYAALGGGEVAVRSSALDEDGAVASFAGQYETVLGVRGDAELLSAIERCILSARSARSRAYRNTLGGGSTHMAVVVQRMVRPRVAGVCFTADPVSGARDRLVVNAIAGLGEALVSGHAAADAFVLGTGGDVLERDVRGPAPVLSDDDLAAIASGARKAEANAGRPLDLEWAITGDGDVWWLQARPITALGPEMGGPAIDELDSPAPAPGSVLTTYNVSEVMPGALTPLTISSICAPDHAVQDLAVRIGVQPAYRPPGEYVVVHSAHLFLNLTNMYRVGTAVLGASKEEIDFTLCGRVLEDVSAGPQAPFLTRLLNSARYVRYLALARSRVAAFEAEAGGLRFDTNAPPEALFAEIDRKRPLLLEGAAVHANATALSSALHGALLRAIGGACPAGAARHADAAVLLASRPSSAREVVESADVVASLERLADMLASRPDADHFAAMASDAALAWLEGPESGPAGRVFAAFLETHGHRCLLESELREKDWREDPLPIVTALKAHVARHRAGGGPKRNRQRAEDVLAQLSPARRLVVQKLLPVVQDAVALRERSKSTFMRMVRRFKRAYVVLGEALVALDRLVDLDLTFFVTHDELGALACAADPQRVRWAVQRRRLLDRQRKLRFPPLNRGMPVALDSVLPAPGSTILKGTPVSVGRVKAPARVVATLEDAKALQPGEILITPFTDIGWSPYFSLAGGMASEIGSPLSHGAVVARECGLPAIVNVPSVTRAFKTGDWVMLDGGAGTICHAP